MRYSVQKYKKTWTALTLIRCVHEFGLSFCLRVFAIRVSPLRPLFGKNRCLQIVIHLRSLPGFPLPL